MGLNIKINSVPFFSPDRVMTQVMLSERLQMHQFLTFCIEVCGFALYCLLSELHGIPELHGVFKNI